MERIRSRRRFLATAAATTAALAAGCSSGPDPKLQLDVDQIDDLARGPSTPFGQYLVDPLDVDSEYSVELSDEYKRAKVNELVDTGTVSTRGWELSSRSTWGPTRRDKRTAFEHGGTYYRVWVESQSNVERERWVFYFDWDDQDPAEDATIITLSDNSLSEQDQQILEAAEDFIPARNERDVAYERPRYSRAVVFHEDLDADASDLVPDPPFDYLEHDGEYFRAVSEQGPVARPEQTFTVDAVGDSFEAYREYAEEAYPDVRFSDVDLSDEATDVLDEATGGGMGDTYEEEPPPSTGLEEVLTDLTISEHLDSQDDESMYFYNAVTEYEGRWYDVDFVSHA